MFKALRSFNVTGADGKTRSVKPGDAVPEAATWKRLSAYIQRRWITNEKGEMWNGKHFITLKAEKQMRRAAPEIPPPAPEPVDDGGGDETEFRAPGEYMESELEKMKKADLVAIAEHFGVDAFGNKAELIEAIMGAE